MEGNHDREVRLLNEKKHLPTIPAKQENQLPIPILPGTREIPP
jgi:hypothetical protein